MPKTIADFRAEYAKADGLVQEVQLFRNKAGIPAILELRNAGHHLLKAIDDQGQLTNQDELVSAISHTRRACYEATEAGIPKTPVAGVIPDYVNKLCRCDDGLRAIEKGRQPGFNRDADHQARIEVFRELKAFCRDLDVGREEMNKKVAEATKAARRFTTQIVLGLIAVLITVGGITWAATGYRSFWKAPAPVTQPR